MLDRRGGYEYEDLLACGRGEMFARAMQQLHCPDADVRTASARFPRPAVNTQGLIRAELDVKPDLWFFGCHFKGDP